MNRRKSAVDGKCMRLYSAGAIDTLDEHAALEVAVVLQLELRLKVCTKG
jgi:hypothetical protein